MPLRQDPCAGDELAVAAEPIDWESEGSGAM